MRLSLLSSTAGLALAACLCVDAVSASAATITVTPATSNTGNLSAYQLDIPLFQESLGTLTSVLVTTTFSANYGTRHGTFSFSALSSASATGTATTKITASGGPSDLDGSMLVKVSNLFSDLNKSGGTAVLSKSTIITPTGVSYTDVANWETATVGGYSIVNLSSLLNTDSLSGASGLTFNPGSGPDVNVGYSITYTYTPAAAPEPAGIFPLGAGLIALGVFRRRSKRGPPPPLSCG